MSSFYITCTISHSSPEHYLRWPYGGNLELPLVLYYIYIYIYKYYSVQLNRSWSNSIGIKIKINSEHVNFPGKELNVRDITEQ